MGARYAPSLLTSAILHIDQRKDDKEIGILQEVAGTFHHPARTRYHLTGQLDEPREGKGWGEEGRYEAPGARPDLGSFSVIGQAVSVDQSLL